MIKKIQILLLAVVIALVTVINPNHSLATSNTSSTFFIGNEEYELIELNSDQSITVLKLKKNNRKEISTFSEATIEVNHKTGDIIVTEANGNVIIHNVNEFIVEEIVEDAPNETDQEIINKLAQSGIEERVNLQDSIDRSSHFSNNELAHDSDMISINSESRHFLTDLNKYFNISSQIDWQLARSIKCSTCSVHTYIFHANVVEYTTTTKKLEFDSGTKISIILGAIVAIIGFGLTTAALTSILTGLGITIVSGSIAHAIDPSIRVKRYSYLRTAYVQEGYTLGTKSYTDYVEGVYNGRIHEEQYRTGKYQNWYNDIPEWQLAYVAFEMYRYIKHFRNYRPTRSEFYWG